MPNYQFQKLSNSQQQKLWDAHRGKYFCIEGYIDGLAATDDDQVIYPKAEAYYDLMAAGGETLGIASSDAGDTEKQITVIGVDENYNYQSEVVTLNNANAQTPVALTGTWGGVNVVYPSSGNTAGTIYIGVGATAADWTAGVPNDSDDATNPNHTLAILDPDYQINQNAYYTVPAGYSLFVTTIDARINVGNTAATSPKTDIAMFTKSSGGIKKLLRGALLRLDSGSPKDIVQEKGVVKIPEKTRISVETRNLTGSDVTLSTNVTGLIFPNSELTRG